MFVSVCERDRERERDRETEEEKGRKRLIIYMYVHTWYNFPAPFVILTPLLYAQVEAVIHPQFLAYLLSQDPQLDFSALEEKLEEVAGLTPSQVRG